jgi:hypothetical protein
MSIEVNEIPTHLAVWFTTGSHQPMCRPVPEDWQPSADLHLVLYVIGERTDDGSYRARSWKGYCANGKPIGVEVAQAFLDSVLQEMGDNPDCVAATYFRHPSVIGRLLVAS